MDFIKRLKKAIGRAGADPLVSEEDLPASPEVMCDIKPGMTQPEIKEHLAFLYKRHNRAASSLDEERRKEAEEMLDAIVICREKYVDKV